MMAHAAFVFGPKLSPAGYGGMQSLHSYDQCRWLPLLPTRNRMELNMLRMVGKQLWREDRKRPDCREEDGV